MTNLRLNNNEIHRWFSDNGDYTHNITYDLTESSTIMDLGGYTGVWAQQMINKYNPNVYILEPIPEFHDIMKTKFKDNEKVHLMCVGVASVNRIGEIYLSGDGTSSNLGQGKSISVEYKTIEAILTDFELDSVDLLQINIEGDEYPLLENMLDSGSINKFKNIQIQFHLGIENDVEKRNKIRNGLERNGFKINFDYPFVWESWGKI